MLMAVMSLTNASGTLLYYTAGYALAGIAAFAVVIYVCQDKGNESIENFNGLGKTNPLMAGVLTCALLSMAGIPVFAGFLGKFMLFTQTVKAGYLAVVIFAVINSIVSVGYYFRLILAMYTKDAAEERVKTVNVYYVVGVLAILFNLGIGLFPSLITDLFA
jgi:NADH-quinone oxidoreductase subunit N